MNIHILELIEGADQARGLTVVIDVFRAFSLETYLFARGAKEIFAVGKEETARILKMHHEDYVLIGERGGKILPGFDYGNSPYQTVHADLKGRTVIHTTSAGTQGLVHASGADEIITGSLVNARAIARYILDKQPAEVSLVAMGLGGKERAAEDNLCARYIQSFLLDIPFDMEKELQILSQDAQAKKFFNPMTQDIFPKEDYEMCIDYNKYPYVLKAEKVDRDIFRVHKIQTSL